MVKWGADGKEGSMLSGPLFCFVGSRPCFRVWVSFVFVWLWKWLQASVAYMLIIPKPEFPEHLLLASSWKESQGWISLPPLGLCSATPRQRVWARGPRRAQRGWEWVTQLLPFLSGALFPKWGREDVLTGQNGGVCSLFSNIFLKCLEFKYLLLENLIWMASSINEPFGLLIDDYEA